MNFEKKTIEVACAIIRHEGKFLVTQRGQKMTMPLLWEFPGGKIESGETPENCIHREIKEELSIAVTLFKRLPNCVHEYDRFTIVLIPFLADFFCGTIQLAEHQSFKWLKTDEFALLDWAPADIKVVQELVQFLENS
jgi:8-oxo-dGTP diphosphatase